MMSADAEQLLKEEVENNELFHVNSKVSRQRFVAEFKRRFNAVPYHFWETWQGWSETGQRAGLFYAILKTYKLVFDFHFNVTIKRWNSIDHEITRSDIMMELNEIAAHDEYVDSWSDSTKERSASQYLTIMRQVGLLAESTNQLQPVRPCNEELAYYFRAGEEWFLEACLLHAYEINDIKSSLL